MKETDKKENQNLKSLFTGVGSYLFDGILLITFIVIFICEFKGFLFAFPYQNMAVDIIVVLLPTIITVLSIVLSLTKERVCGVKISEFNRLRGFWFYNFLHMLICLIGIFVAYTLSSILGLKISLLVIDSVCVFYALYFSIQEIPILLNDYKAIGRIIKKSYIKQNKEDTFYSQKDRKILFTAITNILLEEGLVTAFNMFKKDDDKPYNATLFNYLLDAQNKYFFNAIDDVELIKSNINGTYKNIHIIKMIDTGFDNVINLLEFKQYFDYKEIVTSSDITYQLTRSVFSLVHICTKLDLEIKKKKKLTQIADTLLFPSLKAETSSKHYSFVCLMAITSLSSGDTWFLDSLGDSDYASVCLFTLDKNPIGLFISILLSYFINSSSKYSEKFISFINKPLSGLNIDGRSWKDYVASYIDYGNPEYIVNLLPLLLEIYNSINDSYFTDFLADKFGNTSYYNGFSKEYVFHAWFEIISFNETLYSFENNVEQVLENLSEEDKKMFARYVTFNCVKDGVLQQDFKLEFLSVFSDRYYARSNYSCNKEMVKIVFSFSQRYIKKELNKRMNNSKIEIRKIEEVLYAPFIKVKNDLLFDENINLNNQNPLAFAVRIKGFDADILIDKYAESLKNSLIFSIKKEFKNNFRNENKLTVDHNFQLTVESIDKISKLKPDFASSKNLFIYNKQNDILKGIEILQTNYLPNNFFWKNGAASFKIELDKEKTIIRYITREEALEIIDNEYTLVNGLYRYSEFANDSQWSCLVTKKELINYLLNSIIVIRLVFRQKVVLDEDRYLVLENK